jgi:hypothetical protein
MREQDTLSELAAVPVHFDVANLSTSTSTADGAAVPVALGLSLSTLTLRLNVATNLMEAAFDFDLTMQWHDARLEMSPCGLVYGTILTAATSDAQQQADAATLLRTMWYPSVAMLPSTDAASGADVVYDSTQFALGNDVPWVTGTGPLDPTRNVPFARCHKCVTYTLSGTANVTLAPIWTYDFFPFDQHDISFVVSPSMSSAPPCPCSGPGPSSRRRTGGAPSAWAAAAYRRRGRGTRRSRRARDAAGSRG